MAIVREAYSAQALAANTTTTIKSGYLAGFLAKVTGTITVTARNDLGTADVTIVDAVPVTAGTFTPIPLASTNNQNPITVVLAGGAAGTIFV